jgi:hypothetical protein
MKNIVKLICLTLMITSCGDFEPIVYDNVNGQTGVGFTTNLTSVVVREEGATATIAVQSTILSSSDRTFDVSVNAEESTGSSADYSIGSLTIPANSYDGTLVVTFGNFENLPDLITNKLVLDLALPDDAVVIGSSSTTINYVKYLICNDVVLSITTDIYGDETTWDVKDSSGTVLESGGPLNRGVASYTWEFTLADGCYTFTIYDAYGDGLYDGGNTGTYSLDCSIINLVSGGGNFGSSETTEFCINP